MPWRGAGVAIPMFSIRSESDLGVGEFVDLKLLVDWAVASGFHLVQLLPINDTSVHGMWWDSYPYRCDITFHKATDKYMIYMSLYHHCCVYIFISLQESFLRH